MDIEKEIGDERIIPRISVAMTTYNGEKYLRDQMDSLLRQTYLPFEIIVVDDASNDGTWEMLQEFEKEVPFVHCYQNEKNLGPLGSFRRAFSLVKGDYIAPCDQDDIWFEDRLEKCYMAMDDTIRMVFCQDRIWYADGSFQDTHHPTYSLDDILYSPRCTGHTCLFDRKALEVFDWVSFICFDWALVLWGISAKAYKQIDYVGCKWRRHTGALTNTVGGGNSFLIDKKSSKWKRFFRALWSLMIGKHSNCIEKDARDQSIILSRFVESNESLRPYCVLANCYQKQTFFSMLHAAFTNVFIWQSKPDYKQFSLKTRLARMSWAFRYPYIWWLDLRTYLESIGCY